MPNSSFINNNQTGFVARSGDGDNAAPLSITEISSMLKRTVEDRFGFVRLRGELSGVKRAASGHLYCSLKDDNAVIDGVMWRGNAGRLSFRPEDGIEVVATGKVTTYPGRSKYQIVMESMEIAGEGALLALLEKTKARLEAEGLFASERKKPIPFLPKTIAVVTSPTGAVIRDILHRLADRFPSHVLVWPVLVQGQGSAEQVAAAIRGFSNLPDRMPKPDVLIVARGGGSIEDLWGFNEEAVVRAIADCPIPVISAIGHETDTTLADFAADRRAPTPTAAAEMAVPVRAELAAAIEDLAHRKKRAITRPVSLGQERLAVRVQRLPKAENLLQPHIQKVDDLTDRLGRGLKDRAAAARARLQSDPARLSAPLLMARIGRAGDRLRNVRFSGDLPKLRLARDAERFAALERLYLSLNPEAPLSRGFVLVKDRQGNLVRSKAEAYVEPTLEIKFKDGSLEVATGAKTGVVTGGPPSGEGGAASIQSAPAQVKPAKPRKKPKPIEQDDLFG